MAKNQEGSISQQMLNGSITAFDISMQQFDGIQLEK